MRAGIHELVPQHLKGCERKALSPAFDGRSFFRTSIVSAIEHDGHDTAFAEQAEGSLESRNGGFLLRNGCRIGAGQVAEIERDRGDLAVAVLRHSRLHERMAA